MSSHLLLDTTYLLPLFQVELEKVSADVLLSLVRSKKYKLYYSSISLFELVAKGAKINIDDKNYSSEEIITGIDTLLRDHRLEKLEWFLDPIVVEFATEIRTIHSDFIDCLIFATALIYTDIFATCDKTLFTKVSSDEQIKKHVLDENAEIKFWFDDLTATPIGLSKT